MCNFTNSDIYIYLKTSPNMSSPRKTVTYKDKITLKFKGQKGIYDNNTISVNMILIWIFISDK